MKHSDDFLSVVKAINKARPNFSQPDKDKTVRAGSGTWQYSTLESILTACQKALSDEGVEMFGGVVKNDHGDWMFEIKFIHIDGAWMSFTHPVFEDSNQRDRNKAVGSGRTYAWRYVLSSALGLGADPDIDDDGDLAYPEQNKGKTITNSPRTNKSNRKRQSQQQQAPEDPDALSTVFGDIGLRKSPDVPDGLQRLSKVCGWEGWTVQPVRGHLMSIANELNTLDEPPKYSDLLEFAKKRMNDNLKVFDDNPPKKLPKEVQKVLTLSKTLNSSVILPEICHAIDVTDEFLGEGLEEAPF